MDDWHEIRTAATLARHGTIGAAANELGVHRATVNRHVEHLERLLGARLFQRHHRGMTPTRLGEKLLRIADATNAQFGELVREAKGLSGELEGDFTITSVDVLAPMVLPVVNQFQAAHPKLRVRYVSSDRVLRLAYGEADVAFRIGPPPADQDNVVRPFRNVEMGLYAAKEYETAYGVPQSREDFSKHVFIGPDNEAPAAPFLDWTRVNIPEDRISFRSNSVALMWLAVTQGTGIGFLPEAVAANNPQLIEVLAPREEWREPVWTVTHVDLHRSTKVQAFLDVLKSHRPERIARD